MLYAPIKMPIILNVANTIEDFIRRISYLKNTFDSVGKTSTDIKIFSFICQTKTIIPLAFLFNLLYVYIDRNET